jgi:hypothetical protein
MTLKTILPKSNPLKKVKHQSKTSQTKLTRVNPMLKVTFPHLLIPKKKQSSKSRIRMDSNLLNSRRMLRIRRRKSRKSRLRSRKMTSRRRELLTQMRCLLLVIKIRRQKNWSKLKISKSCKINRKFYKTLTQGFLKMRQLKM